MEKIQVMASLAPIISFTNTCYMLLNPAGRRKGNCTEQRRIVNTTSCYQGEHEGRCSDILSIIHRCIQTLSTKQEYFNT